MGKFLYPPPPKIQFHGKVQKIVVDRLLTKSVISFPTSHGFNSIFIHFSDFFFLIKLPVVLKYGGMEAVCYTTITF